VQDGSGVVTDPDAAASAVVPGRAPQEASLAVLPFRTVPQGDDDIYFAEGIAEHIIHMLAAQKEIFVISHTSTSRYSGRQVDQRTVASELGVRYLLSGSCRRANGTFRLWTELTDCEAGVIVRSDQFDGALDDLFQVQESIAIRVAAAIAPQVRERELRRAMRKPPSSMTAHDLVLQALDRLYRMESRAFARAGELLERAIALDPTYAPAYTYKAYWHIFDVGEGRAADPAADARAAADAAGSAIELDPNDAVALAIYGHVQSFLLGDYVRALHYLDRALAAGPNCALAWTMSSVTRGYLGQGEEAVRHAQRGLLLSPLDAHIFWHEGQLAQALYINNQFDEAIAMAQRVALRSTGLMFNLRVLIASLVAAGRQDDARRTALLLLRAQPGFRLSVYAERCPFRGAIRAAWLQRLLEAELPE
jgi:TolB-like protein/Tfp pilus assembly protein PilF